MNSSEIEDLVEHIKIDNNHSKRHNIAFSPDFHDNISKLVHLFKESQKKIDVLEKRNDELDLRNDVLEKILLESPTFTRLSLELANMKEKYEKN